MRTLYVAAAAVLLAGCQKQQLAPEPEPEAAELRMSTDGLWQSSNVRVSGEARGMDSVTINGESVTIEGSQFSTDLPAERGVNLIEAVGTDSRGDTHFVRQGVLSGEFHAPDQQLGDALTIRLNRTGLTKATDLVGGLIDPVAISSGVTALNPVYEDSYGVLGWDAVNIQANVVDVGFDAPVITPDPKPNILEVEVAIPNVEIQANAQGDVVGIDFDQDVWVGSDAAIITANVLVGASNGELVIDVVQPTVELDGFWYDVSLIPGDIESYLLVDTLRGTLEDVLVGKLDEMLPGLLEGALADLDISVETELLGTPVSISADFAAATVDTAGIEIVTNVNVAVPQRSDKPWTGFLAAPAVATPAPSQADDLGVSVSDDLLNNVLFQVWRGGLLNMELDSANGDIDPALLGQLGAKDAAKVILDANLPPVLIERGGATQVQLTELGVRVETPDGDNGEYLDLSVTAFVGLELVIEEGVLKLQLGEPNVIVDVRDSDWGASNNAITNLLADQLPIDTLLLLLGDIEFPLPSVAGISVNNGEAWRDQSGVHTGIGINL